MGKEQLVKLIASNLGITQVAAKELLKDIDAVVELAAENLEDGAKVKIGSYFTVERNFKEARTGEITRVENGEKVKKEFTVEAHSEVNVKKTAAVKNL